MIQRDQEAAIAFAAPLLMLGAAAVVRLPEHASTALPSRGQVAARGTINGVEIRTVVEPDGRFGHWIKVPDDVLEVARLRPGETASVELQVTKDWPEPALPEDLAAALDAAPQEIHDLWKGITPMARWEWVRWVNATRNPDTRRRRVEVSISKMEHGKRRPCCFDLASCTDPDLSRSGRLIEPGVGAGS
jgi:Bacteriocin-protection, YdeI or OmpD-Associated/Domain of unknown function (DUF1905)